jgi:hypothetical protein
MSVLHTPRCPLCTSDREDDLERAHDEQYDDWLREKQAKEELQKRIRTYSTFGKGDEWNSKRNQQH